jgi:hypothetical protein
MKAQGFRFDPNRQIKGVGPWHGNKTATNHLDCYAEPPKTRASRTQPTVGAARVPGCPLRMARALTAERSPCALLLRGVTLSTSVAGSPPRLPDIFVGR